MPATGVEFVPVIVLAAARGRAGAAGGVDGGDVDVDAVAQVAVAGHARGRASRLVAPAIGVPLRSHW